MIRSPVRNGSLNRPDLIGGGLVRSAGGWDALKELRKIKAYMKGGERILDDSDFVDAGQYV